jgi:hypothetical protein
VSSKTRVATIAGSATTSSRPRASRADRATNSARSAVKSKNDAGQIHRDDTAEVFNGPIQLDFPCHANSHFATINAKLDGELVDRADHVHHADGISITERRPLLGLVAVHSSVAPSETLGLEDGHQGPGHRSSHLDWPSA